MKNSFQVWLTWNNPSALSLLLIASEILERRKELSIQTEKHTVTVDWKGNENPNNGWYYLLCWWYLSLIQLWLSNGTYLRTMNTDEYERQILSLFLDFLSLNCPGRETVGVTLFLFLSSWPWATYSNEVWLQDQQKPRKKEGKWSCSVKCDSWWSHGLLPTRLLHQWDFPGKNPGVGLPFPSPGDLPNPGIKPRSPIL